MSRAKTSAEALAAWKRIEAGDATADDAIWLQSIAGALVRDVFEARFDRAARRAEAALRAVGYVGRLYPHAELDALAQADFTVGESARFVAEVAPMIVSTSGTPEQIRKRVEHARRGKR